MTQKEIQGPFEKLQVYRFDQVSREAGIPSSLANFFMAKPRQRDQGNLLSAGTPPNLARGFETIHFGHVEIQEYDAGLLPLQGGERGRPTVGFRSIDSQQTKQSSQRVCRIAVVIDDQDGRRQTDATRLIPVGERFTCDWSPP